MSGLLAVTGAEPARILACTEPDVLETWVGRAFEADGVGEIFGDAG